MSFSDGNPARLPPAAERASPVTTPQVPTENVARSRELALICRSHHAALVRFLSVRTGSTEDAKEILQEAYTKLLSHDRPGTINLLVGYLWRTAVNLAMDRRRERAVHERFFRTAAPLTDVLDISAEQMVEIQQRLDIVERAIGELPPRCLQAFGLRVLNGLRFEEVGREMRVSARMAQKHVARALDYLQSCIDAADESRCAR